MPRHAFPAILPVLHGAPLLHRPKGAREERLILARIFTDCAIGRCAQGDLAPVHIGPYGLDAYYERDGDLWARVAVSSPSVRHEVLTPDRFASLLRDEADPADQFNLAFRRYFARTPLAPRDAVSGCHVAFEAKRAQGVDLPARGPGLVLDDGRDRLAGEMRAFLSDEILVTEEAVHLRFAPLVRGREDDAGYGFSIHPTRTFALQLKESPPMPAECRRSYRPAAGKVRPWRDLACVEALGEAGWLERHGDADLRILANALPAWILGSVGSFGQGRHERGVPEPLLGELRKDAILGMAGSIAAADVQPVISRIDRALRGHAPWLVKNDRYGYNPGHGTYATALADHVSRSAVERAARLPAADAEALSGLAPGR